MALERTRRKASANIAQAEAEFRAREVGHREEQSRLARVEAEISKARIHAPIDGMVLYASSVSSDWDDDEDRIQEGATVDERGEIIYLPTADAFDVDIRIPEVELTKVKRGLPVRIRVDALPGKHLTGTVSSIAPLPDSQSRFWNPNLKLYNAVIEVDTVDIPLRNGMSCHVEIIVDEFDDALYVPVQTVVAENGQPTVYRVQGNQGRPTVVELGLDNNRVVQILGGLKAGETVLLAPPLNARPASRPVEAPNPEPVPVGEARTTDAGGDAS
jgi:HlyD family secretion protein